VNKSRLYPGQLSEIWTSNSTVKNTSWSLTIRNWYKLSVLVHSIGWINCRTYSLPVIIYCSIFPVNYFASQYISEIERYSFFPTEHGKFHSKLQTTRQKEEIYNTKLVASWSSLRLSNSKCKYKITSKNGFSNGRFRQWD